LKKEHLEMIEEAIADEKEPHRIPGPIKFILGLFLVILMILIVVPHYYVKDNPHPNSIPEISEVYTPVAVNRSNISISSRDQYLLFIDARDKDIKGVADRVSSLACDYSENYIMCQTKALYLFVRDNFDYVRDPSSFEYVKTPIESLNNLGGDCDDASVLLSSLLGSIGVKTRLVFVPNHVYVEAYLPEASSKYKSYKKQDWVAMDPTCKNCDFGEIPISDIKADKTYLSAT